MFLVAAVILAQKGQGPDGNPHGWDRNRRCDGNAYSPKCGICEGFGGIPTGDENDQITLTTCEPKPTPATTTRPKWSTTMTTDPYYSVQIGPKKDPFCFQAIPENSSAGALCYQRQTGSQIYDMDKARALRFDVNLATGAGNVSSAVVAKGPYLWIVNTLPLGVKQCICTEPREGGDHTSAEVFPLQYNWTNRLSFVGLEKIGIEYMQPPTKMVLEHWNYGPHHIWSVPGTGSIIRMWQPFNGLQVFPNGTLPSPVDESKLTVLPPPECTSAYRFVVKIKCNASGYPSNYPPSAPESKAAAAPEADVGMWRTKTKVPRHAYRGETFEQMSATLNGWIIDALGPDSVKSCDDWNVEELQKLQASLYMLRYPAYNDVYSATSDAREIDATIEDMRETWAQLNAAASKTGFHSMHRDGHCHEAVMWFTHHLQEDAKKVLNKQGVVIPLLSAQRHVCPENPTEEQAAICHAYDYKVSCSDCHANALPSKEKKANFLARQARRVRRFLRL